MAEPLRVEIIAVGSELLTPYYSDTNSLELTRRLNAMGIDVGLKTIVGDERERLSRCLKDAADRSSLIVVMGGLGPTRDDITRETLAEVFGMRLEIRKNILNGIQKRFERRGLPMPEVNTRQACVPVGADILTNRHGTAPGLWIERDSRVFILLPGPPREIIPMFESEVLPRLEKIQRGYQVRRVLKITGLTESKVEALIGDLYPREAGLSMTVLASLGQIELHLTAFSPSSREAADARIERLMPDFHTRLGKNLFSCNGEELEERVGRLLLRFEATLAVAESCTGGRLGDRLTDVPGSSQYFLEGVLAYSNAAKIRLLGVPPEIIERNGAVSRETAEWMAVGVRERSGADFGLSITGIAGPGGATPEKPVGRVHTALAWNGGCRVDDNQFLGDRGIVKRRSAQKALDMLRRHLMQRIDSSTQNTGL